MANRPRGLQVDENRLAAYRQQRERQIFSQLPSNIRRIPASAQAQPPTPRTVVSTDCPSCAARGVRVEMVRFPPGFYDCRKCGFRLCPK